MRLNCENLSVKVKGGVEKKKLYQRSVDPFMEFLFEEFLECFSSYAARSEIIPRVRDP